MHSVTDSVSNALIASWIASFRAQARTRVTPLLEAGLVALSAEPAEYDERGRGGHLAALILDEVARTPATPFVLPVPSDQRLAKLTRLLIGNPASPLDINGWADEIGVSRRTLTRLFRAQTSLSFGSWRRRLRLLAAVARLADGEPLARAAASVGYRSAATFRAMAQREFGGTLDESRPLARFI
jgi:AraC-like DNA-binding protein